VVPPSDLYLAGGELVNIARCLLLSDGDAVDALPHRVEINRYCIEPLLIGGPNAIMDDPARSRQRRLRPNGRTSRATPEVETYKH
jgi:hypothetical protein